MTLAGDCLRKVAQRLPALPEGAAMTATAPSRPGGGGGGSKARDSGAQAAREGRAEASCGPVPEPAELSAHQ